MMTCRYFYGLRRSFRTRNLEPSFSSRIPSVSQLPRLVSPLPSFSFHFFGVASFYSILAVGDPSHAASSASHAAARKGRANLCGIYFDLEDRKGSLMSALKLFAKYDVNLTRIENRPSPLNIFSQIFFVHFEGDWESENVQKLLEELKNISKSKSIAKRCIPEVPWFPTRISDIDQFSKWTLDAGAELTSDHPGFNDPEYRERRKFIVSNAAEFRTGQRIPSVDYTDKEIQTWTHVYDRLRELHAKHACEEYLDSIGALETTGIYRRDQIPQLEDLSHYLQQKTGFTLRPVSGLLSGRDFLNALAFRVFFSTQYIRHHSVPLYTPEPDLIHELMGHAPLLANIGFAEFSQIIGLASLGATEDQINQLSSCYWFSVEFGLIYEEAGLKAYGAGLLSSFGELQFATSPTNARVEIREWNPFAASTQEYPITSYQPVYYAVKNLAEAKTKMLDFCYSLGKPFSIRFDSEAGRVLTDVLVKPRPVSIKF